MVNINYMRKKIHECTYTFCFLLPLTRTSTFRVQHMHIRSKGQLPTIHVRHFNARRYASISRLIGKQRRGWRLVRLWRLQGSANRLFSIILVILIHKCVTGVGP